MSEVPKCGCRIGTIKASRSPYLDDSDEPCIIKCPLCKAAPALLEALKACRSNIASQEMNPDWDSHYALLNKIEAVIFKAESAG